MTGVIVLAVALAAALLFGWWRSRTDGRLRAVPRAGGALESDDSPAVLHAGAEADRVGPAELGTELGSRATLLQFSSAFCAPCRTTRVVLADVASAVPGVRHVEVDAESHLPLVNRLGVLRTPTTLLLDADGVVRLRATGVPRRQEVVAALGSVV